MMQTELQQFIQRVEDFEIDPGNKALRFVDRLARENNWTLTYSERVIREYKRFCILAMRAGHPVTPSEEVDQAWHLHLTYTRSYWERFCQQTLDGPLHHEPTAGGRAEGEKFRDWYQETLQSYVRLFDEPPPGDIWPAPEQRFRHAGDWKWVNVGRYWMIPRKPHWIVVAGMILAPLALVLPGCRRAFDSPWLLADWGIFPFTLGGSAFLVIYLTLWTVGLVAAAVLRARRRALEIEGMPLAPPPELTPDELAVLSGGGRRLAEVALTRLYAQHAITAKRKFLSWRFEATNIKPECTGLDLDLYHEIRSGTSALELLKAVKPHYERIDAKLQGQGLRRKQRRILVSNLLIVFSLEALGLLRLVQGFQAGEEIGFLTIIIALGFILGLNLSYIKQKQTPLGDAAIARYRALLPSPGSELLASPRVPNDVTQAAPQAAAESLAFSVALLGAAAITDNPALNPLASTLATFQSSTDASGCGGGCSSGSGGCGGGGCGGCGGCGG